MVLIFLSIAGDKLRLSGPGYPALMNMVGELRCPALAEGWLPFGT